MRYAAKRAARKAKGAKVNSAAKAEGQKTNPIPDSIRSKIVNMGAYHQEDWFIDHLAIKIFGMDRFAEKYKEVIGKARCYYERGLSEGLCGSGEADTSKGRKTVWAGKDFWDEEKANQEELERQEKEERMDQGERQQAA